MFVPMIFASALALSPVTEAVTDPVTAPAAVPAAAPVTAPADDMAGVTDFGALDLEAMLNATVESASKKSESIARAPAIIEVLTRRQLLDLGARDLYTALTFLPGVEVLETFGGLPTLVFRGALQEQYNVKVLLLINGHPSYEPVTSGYFLDLIPLESIDRIEVIRGPGSVLYGNNAFAGVINVITVHPDDGKTLVRARADAGQFTTAAGGAGAAGRSGDLAWSLFAAGQSQRGWPYRVTPQQNEDCMPNSPFGQSGPPRPYDCRHTTTIAYFNDYASGLGSVRYKGLALELGGIARDKQKYSFLPTLRFHDFDTTEHVYGDLSYRHEFETLTLTARGGYDRNQQYWRIGRFPDDKAVTLDTKADVLSYIYRASLEAGWQATESLRLDQGVSWEHSVLDHIDFLLEDGTINKFSPQFAAGMPAQSITSYYAQGTWQATESLSLLAGYRLSRFETLGVRVTVDADKVATNNLVDEQPLNLQSPRGGVVYAPRDDLSFKVLYGEAFRLTNISDTATVIPLLIGVASPVLPETIRTVEFGVDSRPVERLSLRANAYASWLDNLVGHRLPNDAQEAATFGPSTILTANLWQQRIQGVEAEATLVATEKLTVFANASARRMQVEPMQATDVEVAGPHKRYFTAPFTANGGASWRPAAWFALHPNAQFVGPRGYAAPYVLVGAVAEFPLTSWLTLSALGSNLLDQTVSNPEYVRRYITVLPGAPGRALYGRATLEF